MPAAALQQLDQLVGARVESFAVLGTQTGASGGLYKGTVNDTAGEVSKLTGRGDVTPPFPLGDSGVRWSVLVEGGVGRVLFDNRFEDQPLAGNRSEVETWSVALGVGVRFTVLEVLSVAPSIGGIYSQIENTFVPGTPLGDTVKQRLGGTLVDWGRGDVHAGAGAGASLPAGVRSRGGRYWIARRTGSGPSFGCCLAPPRVLQNATALRQNQSPCWTLRSPTSQRLAG